MKIWINIHSIVTLLIFECIRMEKIVRLKGKEAFFVSFIAFIAFIVFFVPIILILGLKLIYALLSNLKEQLKVPELVSAKLERLY